MEGMEFEVGGIYPGKVMSITKFGAFVSIAPNKSGLVHISEIANTYVSDVNAFLTVGQEVQVKLIGIDELGRINLSIKQALPQESRPVQRRSPDSPRPSFDRGPRPTAPVQRAAPAPTERRPFRPEDAEVPQTSGDAVFEDKLKRFMQDSESKMSGSSRYNEKRSSRRRGGRGGNYDD